MMGLGLLLPILLLALLANVLGWIQNQQFGGRLERSQTIAAGCDPCDFYFRAKTDQSLGNFA